MYAPTARSTPTRLPMLLWALSAALLLLGTFASAFASDRATAAPAFAGEPVATAACTR